MMASKLADKKSVTNMPISEGNNLFFFRTEVLGFYNFLNINTLQSNFSNFTLFAFPGFGRYILSFFVLW